MFCMYVGNQPYFAYEDGNHSRKCYPRKPFEISESNGRYLLNNYGSIYQEVSNEVIKKMQEKGLCRVYPILFICDGSLGDNLMSLCVAKKLLKVNPTAYIEVVIDNNLEQKFIWEKLAVKIWKRVQYQANEMRTETYYKIYHNAGEGKSNPTAKKLNRIDVFANSCGVKLAKEEYEIKDIVGIKPDKNDNIIIVLRSNASMRTWDNLYKKPFQLAKKLLKLGFKVEIHNPEKVEIFDDFPNKNLINYTGRKSINIKKHANRIAGCKFVIVCGDTGATHIAGFFDVPCISMYGAVNPKLRLSHYNSAYAIYNRVCKIQPCEFRDYDRNHSGIDYCKDVQCMKSITVDQVFNLFQEKYNLIYNKKEVA